MKKVLVLDACQRSGLAVTRALGARGLDVYTADETYTALAGRSRYSKAYYRYPSPRTEQQQFTRSVASLCNSQNIDLLMPMTELTSALLLETRASLPAQLPFPEKSSVDRLTDKCSLFRLAESLQVPAPTSRYFQNADDGIASLGDLQYPLVLKPARSWLVCDGRWQRSEVKIAHSRQQAEQILKKDPVFSQSPFMIQDYVEGFGQGVFALYDNGKPVAFFSHRRLREKPPSGGVSVLSESVPVDSAQLRHARALLDAVNWHGIAMVEYRVGSDGTPYLMEINTRFWGSLQLAIDAGVDFPYLLLQTCSGQKPAPVDSYRLGRKLRWLLGDLDNLYLTLRDERTGAVRKMAAILRFLRPSPFSTRHEVNRLDDMGPFLLELKEYFSSLS